MNEDVSKRAISYAGATGMLLALAQDFLLHEATLAKEKWAAILVEHTESAGDMPDSLIRLTNELKKKIQSMTHYPHRRLRNNWMITIAVLIIGAVVYGCIKL